MSIEHINQWHNYPHDHLVVCGGEQDLTVADLSRQVAVVQQAFMDAEVASCALFTNDTHVFLVMLLACACSGVDVVLPANNTPDFIAALEVDWLLGDFAEAQEIDLLAPHNHQLQISNHDINVDVFTSGSTGAAKRIRRKISQLIKEVRVINRTWGEDASNVLFVATVSHQHIYGLLFKVLWPLLSRNQLWYAMLAFEELIGTLTERFERLVLISSPAFLKRVYDQHTTQGRLLQVFSSGGVLVDDVQRMAESKLAAPITQVYGSSETGGIAYRQLNQLWQLLDAVQVQIKAGVLWVKSPYCHDRDWQCTHDRVTACDSGFELLGRSDRIVKLEEKRISLMRVEQHMLAHAGIKDVAVLLMEQQRQYLAAVVVLNELGWRLYEELGPVKMKQMIRADMQAVLEPVAIPRQIRFTNQELENTQGKRIDADLMAYFT